MFEGLESFPVASGATVDQWFTFPYHDQVTIALREWNTKKKPTPQNYNNLDSTS